MLPSFVHAVFIELSWLPASGPAPCVAAGCDSDFPMHSGPRGGAAQYSQLSRVINNKPFPCSKGHISPLWCCSAAQVARGFVQILRHCRHTTQRRLLQLQLSTSLAGLGGGCGQGPSTPASQAQPNPNLNFESGWWLVTGSGQGQARQGGQRTFASMFCRCLPLLPFRWLQRTAALHLAVYICGS